MRTACARLQAGGVQALCMFPTLAAWACLLRVGAGLDKYYVWAILGLAVQLARRTTPIVPDAERIDGWPEWAWPALLVVSMSGAIGLFLVRNAQRSAARAKAEAAAEAIVPPTPDTAEATNGLAKAIKAE